MWSVNSSLEKHPSITPGTYDGLASGYFVEVIFENGRKSEKIEMTHGVRGINCEIKLQVTNSGQLIEI